jgi:hypothetical protein
MPILMQRPHSMRMVRAGGTSAFLLLVGLAAEAGGAAFSGQVRLAIAPHAIKICYVNSRLAFSRARTHGLRRPCVLTRENAPHDLCLSPKP